jgi:hypothetical protein
MRRISSSSLFDYKMLAMDQQAEQSPLDLIDMHIDPEAGKEKTRTKTRYFPSAPSIFRILSLWIIFLSITAVVAGFISGDWGASSCKFILPFHHVSLRSNTNTPVPRPFPPSLLSRSLVPYSRFHKKRRANADYNHRCVSHTSLPRNLHLARKHKVTRNAAKSILISGMEY